MRLESLPATIVACMVWPETCLNFVEAGADKWGEAMERG